MAESIERSPLMDELKRENIWILILQKAADSIDLFIWKGGVGMRDTRTK